MTHPDLLRWKATLDTLDYIAEGRNISISNPPCYERPLSLRNNEHISDSEYWQYSVAYQSLSNKIEKLCIERSNTNDESIIKQIQKSINKISCEQEELFKEECARQKSLKK